MSHEMELRVIKLNGLNRYLVKLIEQGNEVDEEQEALLCAMTIDMTCLRNEIRNCKCTVELYQQKFEQLQLRIHEDVDDEIGKLMGLAKALSKKYVDVVKQQHNMWKNGLNDL